MEDMEKHSSNPSSSVKNLQIKTIEEAARESLDYINKRRKGLIIPLKTHWAKYNKAALGGIEWHTIHLVGGMSGSGKTAFVNAIETGLQDLNPQEDFHVLSFNFEMLASRLVTRKLSGKTQKTMAELYSADSSLSDDDFKQLCDEALKIKDYKINYVDIPGNIAEVRNTICNFYNNLNGGKPKDQHKGVVVIVDHVLLVKGKAADKERETLIKLMEMQNELKKTMKIFFMNITQLNRDIENSERILNKDLHYPKKRDIFGSDALWQMSDLVMVLHRPEQLGITLYGPKEAPTKDKIFFHFLKVRDGEPFIAIMDNNLKYNTITDGKL